MRTRAQLRRQDQSVTTVASSSSSSGGFLPSSVDVPLTDEMLGSATAANRQNFSIDSPVAVWGTSPGMVLEDRSLLVDHVNVLLDREMSEEYGSLPPYSDCKYAWAGYEERCRESSTSSSLSPASSSSAPAAVPANGSSSSSSAATTQIPSLPHKIEESWRRKICEWMFEVVDHYKFDREVVSIALYYLDRFVAHNLNAGEAVGRKDFQLLAICCLYTAMKLHGTIDTTLTKKRVRVPLCQFVDLSHGQFDAQQVEEAEMKLMSQVLRWRLNPPTAVTLMTLTLRFLTPHLEETQGTARRKATHTKMFDVARFLTETAACASAVFVVHKPSVVALAAIAKTIDSANDATLSAPEKQRLFAQLADFATQYRADPAQLQRVRGHMGELCPTANQLFIDAAAKVDKTNANKAKAAAAAAGTNPSSPSASSVSSGKRSPDCVSQGATEMDSENPRTKRRNTSTNGRV